MRKDCVLPLCVGIAALVLATAVPASAECRLEKKLKLAPGGSFVLDADDGSVSVTGMPEAGATVVITSNRNAVEEYFSFGFDESAGMVRVTGRRKQHLSWRNNLWIHYEVPMPAQTRLEIRTADGNINTAGVRSDVRLDTGDGNIEVSGVAGKLTAHSGDGNISLREVSGGADLQTNDGRLKSPLWMEP